MNDMKKTLVILAAGIGSRFGGGVKQLTPVDDQGHLIIDYSIHDAIAAGFNKIVFIIRHDIEAGFREVIGDRVERIVSPLGVEVAYAFQEVTDIPVTSETFADRAKPWGTGHAVYCAASSINSDFCVINSDDYYGKEGFVKASEFLGNGYALVGYLLKNTLSENGGVTRGICRTESGVLTAIDETRGIEKTKDGAAVGDKSIDVESLVSMNFWCYPKVFLDVLKSGFPEFLSNIADPMTSEYLLPIIADKMIKEGVSYSVFPTSDKWFGVTYMEDKPAVIEQFKKLIDDGVYSEDLYSDLMN